jgi:hypothetical protein
MTWRIAILCVALGATAGCQTTSLNTLKSAKDKLPFVGEDKPKVVESEYQQAEKLVAIWSDAMYTQPGAKPTRGFGGRFYFYNGEGKAVPVEGQLVVYAYDDSQQDQAADKPSRKYVFTPEQLTEHYSPSDLGASYSFWIPWDELGGVQKAVSLLPVFTSPSGKVVMGQQSLNVLPGKVPEMIEPSRQGGFESLSSDSEQGVRQVSYQDRRQSGQRPTDVAYQGDQWQQIHAFEPKEPAQKRLKSSTIQVPMVMTNRWVRGAAINRLAGTSAEQTAAASYTHPTLTEQSPAEHASVNAPAATSATESPRFESPATRSARPRYLAPRGPDGQPIRVHATTPPRPAEPLLGRPSGY